MKYPEYRWIAVGLILAAICTWAQMRHRYIHEPRMQVIPLELPPYPGPTRELPDYSSKRGFCKLFNVSGTGCEIHY